MVKPIKVAPKLERGSTGDHRAELRHEATTLGRRHEPGLTVLGSYCHCSITDLARSVKTSSGPPRHRDSHSNCRLGSPAGTRRYTTRHSRASRTEDACLATAEHSHPQTRAQPLLSVSQ